MGRHPFAGRYLGEGDMPIEQAIKEHRFAYGAEHDFAAMEQPPGTPPLAIVSPPVAELFERAFAMSAARGGRPAAVEWIAALEIPGGRPEGMPDRDRALALRRLALGARGAASRRRPACRCSRPRCRTRRPALFDLPAFWQQLVAIEHPGPAPDVTARARTKKPRLSRGRAPAAVSSRLARDDRARPGRHPGGIELQRRPAAARPQLLLPGRRSCSTCSCG